MRLAHEDSYRLISRIKEVSGTSLDPPIEVVTDTSEYTRIGRGDVISLQEREFFVSGYVYEPRFGLEDQPKFWVKRGYDLHSGRRVIIKLEFREEFWARFGPFRIPCFRSPEKESEVLQLVAGDTRFMQGETLIDDSGNNVRVVEFIHGKTLFETILEMRIDHEEYYHTRLAPILERLMGCLEAIQMLHDHGLCHGDIRNDHVMIEDVTGKFRWIDFDLHQDFTTFDAWSAGKVLQFVVGMGLATFHEIRTSGRFSTHAVASLRPTDADALHSYRLMNLRKIYPYISERLNTILMRFSLGADVCYDTMSELMRDLREVIAGMPVDCPDQQR